ncbi:MAG: UTP--glucose-1-phosphate uridylyltransferase [Candidatus Moranbacteria bacterium CG_4_10_14_3_um_filter_44_15]|nr:MAG: UTP--glucose-1-phosphate uridylyltransferase [Candidatus Moranbacteria bacterium CG06_land_8_20_14_3_00_43_56]PIV84026.1 MAG: UTP--glucose-1-phosphate uridylyltransferase [Candidatus Moranbacteria bacterium CG17_big_fil_post_rev_8_21_14_2_50_44_12]PIW93072.1 MAG: UTP--glucose-1-phosphate uridylyltransferase [Candidatus Moranbacteria bacterium CG_4_8_14_3_um_filter_43_15]PIX90543.1 MAG: UTP--glucose-1-phosphate uridylyltransferase [Candidatus Moranbacteria bacterium CG_4_10_14_3_um_filter
MPKKAKKSLVRKAILPVAGYGTRLLPATKAQPKEMLSVVDKPAIQYLVEEAVEAGIEEIIFVTGRGKHSIEDHFDHSFELEYNLVEKNKHHLLEEVRKISTLAKFTYVRQPMPLGDGHAIVCASHIVGDEPVLVMFGDSLYDYKKNNSPAKQLIEVYEKYQDAVVGLSPLDWEEVVKFGVIDGTEVGKGIYEIKKFIEKPKQGEAPTNLVAVGKYIVTPEVLEILKNMEQGKSGEIRLADAFDVMLSRNRPLYGYKIKGDWLDTGDKFNFLKATIVLALKHPEVKDKIRDYLKNLKI